MLLMDYVRTLMAAVTGPSSFRFNRLYYALQGIEISIEFDDVTHGKATALPEQLTDTSLAKFILSLAQFTPIKAMDFIGDVLCHLISNKHYNGGTIPLSADKAVVFITKLAERYQQYQLTDLIMEQGQNAESYQAFLDCNRLYAQELSLLMSTRVTTIHRRCEHFNAYEYGLVMALTRGLAYFSNDWVCHMLRLLGCMPFRNAQYAQFQMAALIEWLRYSGLEQVTSDDKFLRDHEKFQVHHMQRIVAETFCKHFGMDSQAHVIRLSGVARCRRFLLITHNADGADLKPEADYLNQNQRIASHDQCAYISVGNWHLTVSVFFDQEQWIININSQGHPLIIEISDVISCADEILTKCNLPFNTIIEYDGHPTKRKLSFTGASAMFRN